MMNNNPVVGVQQHNNGLFVDPRKRLMEMKNDIIDVGPPIPIKNIDERWEGL